MDSDQSSSNVLNDTINISNRSDQQSTQDDINELYQYVLKILVLEYINQPKFQQSAAYSSTYKRERPQARNSLMMMNAGTNALDNTDELRLVELLKKELKDYLYDVTIGVKKVDNRIFKRCLLKLNNDLFMDTAMEATLANMSKAEDLVVYFTKAANNELKKLSIDNMQQELFKQISNFVSMIIKLLPPGTSPDYINKLQDYKNDMGVSNLQMKRKSMTPSQNRISSSPASFQTNENSRNLRQDTRKPTFMIDEIPHSSYFSKLFSQDKLVVQQDVVKVMKEATNFNVCRDYSSIQLDLKNDAGLLSKQDFVQDDAYLQWKFSQLDAINEFLVKFRTFGRAPDSHNNKHTIIPANPRILLQRLLTLVLKLETAVSTDSISFSQSGTFFFYKIAKYWLQDYPCILASIFYTSLNQTILKDEELNIPLMENFFCVVKTKILKTQGDDIDMQKWDRLDIELWRSNCKITAKKCFKTISKLLSGLYTKTKPKFSGVLMFYFTYLEDENESYIDSKTIKKFRRTIFKASEDFYRGLLETLPKEGTFEITDIQNICELVIKEIETIQKKYTKPLFDRINIAVECARMLTQALSVDAPLMIQKIHETAKLEKTEILPVDALELYSALKEIRNIFNQVQPEKERFSFNLESTFGKYLIKFAKNISKNIDKAFVSALKLEKWKPLNGVFYSSSVLDIFKMANQSVEVFGNFDWDYDYTYAYSVTLVLKSFSDGIQQYCSYITDIVQRSLREGAEDTTQTQQTSDPTVINDKHTSRWNFRGLKDALGSSSDIQVPKAYKFEKLVCTMLNNVDTMISLLEKLESKVDSTKLSTIMNETPESSRYKNKRAQKDCLLYTIRVKGAHDIKGCSSNGLSNSSVSVIYSEGHKCIGETIVYPNSNDPIWDQEFDLSTDVGSKATLLFKIFHSPGRFKLVRKNELCGTAALTLTPKQIINDGFPNPQTLQLDTRGEIDIEVSLENEKLDPLFCIGKSYRTLSRTRDRILELMVNKFSPFVDYAFSKEVLKMICGSNGRIKPTDDDTYDAIIPLFDYLNANLNVLAQSLSKELLFMVMLKAWDMLLRTADTLLLPQLDIAKHKLAHAKKALWNMGSTSSVLGYGRPLTHTEIEVVFKWLDAICVDFFYNNGEGPGLELLKNAEYQNLLLIPIYYDKAGMELKKEVARLLPLYYKYISVLTESSEVEVSRHLTTVQRRKTIMANSSKAKRLQYEKDLRLTEASSQERALATLDIILRILITKGEIEYVYKQLHERKRKIKQINVANLVNQVSQGKKICYKGTK